MPKGEFARSAVGATGGPRVKVKLLLAVVRSAARTVQAQRRIKRTRIMRAGWGRVSARFNR
jgi:hypothetical protein